MAAKSRMPVVVVLIVVCFAGAVMAIVLQDATPHDVTWRPPRVSASSAHGSTPLPGSDLIAVKQAAASTTRVVVSLVWFSIAGTLATAAALAFRARQRARAEASLDPGAPLANGPSVVFGTVEGEPGDAPAVVVRVHQTGSEVCNKGAWSYSWKETSRDVEARPFTLVRADGARVQVRPDENVVIHESFVSFVRQDVARRDCVAEIVVGAEVHVTGELSGVSHGALGAYRGGDNAPVLRAPSASPMIVADEPVGDTDGKRARFHSMAAASLATSLLVATALVRSYVLLSLTGTTVLATPRALGNWQVWTQPKNGPGHWIKHFAIRAEATLPSGATVTVEDQCGVAAYDCVDSGKCATLPFQVSTTSPDVHQIGPQPTLRAGGLVLLVMLAGATIAVYAITTRSTRPWYLRAKVNHSGSGRLADSMN